MQINTFQLNVVFYIETSHLNCIANKMKGFYMKCETRPTWVNMIGTEFFILTGSSFRSSHSQMFFKIGVLKNVTIFTGKHQCWNLFLIKLRSAILVKLSVVFHIETSRWNCIANKMKGFYMKCENRPV